MKINLHDIRKEALMKMVQMLRKQPFQLSDFVLGFVVECTTGAQEHHHANEN
jgi:hypothetical protein